MRTELIRIGNSRGIRIPKPLIEQCGLGETVQLSIENNRLIIAPDRRPREGWAESFLAGGPTGDDELLLDGLENEFDREEWRW